MCCRTMTGDSPGSWRPLLAFARRHALLVLASRGAVRVLYCAQGRCENTRDPRGREQHWAQCLSPAPPAAAQACLMSALLALPRAPCQDRCTPGRQCDAVLGSGRLHSLPWKGLGVSRVPDKAPLCAPFSRRASLLRARGGSPPFWVAPCLLTWVVRAPLPRELFLGATGAQ